MCLQASTEKNPDLVTKYRLCLTALRGGGGGGGTTQKLKICNFVDIHLIFVSHH